MARRRVKILPQKRAGGTHNSQHLPTMNSHYGGASDQGEEDFKYNSVLHQVPRHQANAELENKETVVNINADIPFGQEVRGNTHAKGGVPANLEEGAFVFSEKLKPKSARVNEMFNVSGKKNKSFAELSKPFIKTLNESAKKLAEGGLDKISTNTTHLNFSNSIYKLGQLALLQEASKGFPDGIPTIAQSYLMLQGIDPEEIVSLGEDQLEQQFAEDDLVMGQKGFEFTPDMEISLPENTAAGLYDPNRDDNITDNLKVTTSSIRTGNPALAGAMGLNWGFDKINDNRDRRRLRNVINNNASNPDITTLASRGDWTPNPQIGPDLRPNNYSFIKRDPGGRYNPGNYYAEDGGQMSFNPESGVFMSEGKLYDAYGNPAPEDLMFEEDLKTFQDAGEYNPDEDELTGESKAIEYYKQRTGKIPNFYGNASLEGFERFKQRNPWFDFSDFNPSDKDHIKRFQQQYNELVSKGEQLKVDGKFGDQTESAHIPWLRDGEPVDEKEKEKVGGIDVGEDPLDQAAIYGDLPTQYWTPDLLQIAGAIADMNIYDSDIISPRPGYTTPQYTFKDPSGSISRAQSMYANQQDFINAYGSPQQAMGAMTKAAGETMSTIGDISRAYNEANVGIANRQEEQSIALHNQAQKENAAAEKYLADAFAIRGQQKDNTRRLLRDKFMGSVIKAHDNAAKTATLNDMYSDQYYIDPRTGRIKFIGKDRKFGEPDPLNLGQQFAALRDMPELANVSDDMIFKLLTQEGKSQKPSKHSELEAIMGMMRGERGGENKKLRRVKIG